MAASRLALALGTLVSCTAGAQVRIGTLPRPDPSAHRETVPFVTVRAIEHDKEGFGYFGPGRGEASAGDCTVDLGARAKRQIVGLRRRALSEVSDQLYASAHHAAVYVHGYNVAFEQSCRDAARLQQRLGAELGLLLFSWPAEGKVMAYLKDVGDVEWSVEPLSELIIGLADRFGAQNVDLIAHSLGAKAVVDAVTGDAIGRAGLVLGRVVLAAPDLDVDVFLRNVSKLRERTRAVTVYVSPQDRALKASRQVRTEPRLGEGVSDLSGLEGLEGLDIVEVEQRRLRWGSLHEYYLDNAAVGEDLQRVLSEPPHASGSRIIER